MRALILDDLPVRHDTLADQIRVAYRTDPYATGSLEITHCFCVQAAIYAVERQRFSLLYLDHDLEDYERDDVESESGKLQARYTERTGFDFVRWLIRNPPNPLPEVRVHSAN